MILRKPYAFFIKYFKIIHIIIAIFIGFLIYKTNSLINFFSKYLSSVSSVAGQKLIINLFSNFLFIIPIIIIFISIIILGIMYKKNKPYKFYMVTIFSFIVILVIFVYTKSILSNMQDAIINIRTVKLTHDLLVITVFLESVCLMIFFARGFGLNFKKFDFSSDIGNINVGENDSEEFELGLNLDLYERKRNFNKKIRYFKYSFKENKFIILILISIIIVLIVALIVYFKSISLAKINYEKSIINFDGINLIVEESNLIKDHDVYLVVVKIKINSIFNDQKIYLNDLILNIENYRIKPTTKYCDLVDDIGICYKQEVLNSDEDNYILVYEIPETYIKSNMKLNYAALGKTIIINLNPVQINTDKKTKKYNLNDKIKFEGTVLKNVEINILSYDIESQFKLDYSYFITKSECINSYEYLTPSIDTNFDKAVLKLEMLYTGNSYFDSFYKLFDKYGSIIYTLNGQTYKQYTNFEEIKSKKVNTKNNIYIGINSEILSASSIVLRLTLRNTIYEYTIRGE